MEWLKALLEELFNSKKKSELKPDDKGLVPESPPIVPDQKSIDHKSLKKRLAVFEASRWVGVREVGGDNKGQVVEMFQKAVDGKAQGEPWCAGFCSFVIKAVDEAFGVMFAEAASNTSLVLSEHVMTMWTKAPSQTKSKVPEPGSLVCWQFYKDGKPTGLGHVGLVVRVIDSKNMETIEGNTNDGSSVEREGVGVFRRTRAIEGAGTMRVVGFLKPWC